MNNCKNLTNEEKTNETIEEMMDEEKRKREYWGKFKDITYDELLTLAKYDDLKVWELGWYFGRGAYGLERNEQKALECERASAEMANDVEEMTDEDVEEKTNETIEEMTNEDVEEMTDKEKRQRKYWGKFKDITYNELLTLAKYDDLTVCRLEMFFGRGAYGLKRNRQKSLECKRASAEMGNVGSQYILGVYLFNVEKEYDEALFWLKKAAEGEKTRSYTYIAQIYDFRAKNEQDIEKNLEYWKLYFQKTKEWVEARKRARVAVYASSGDPFKRYEDILHDLSDAEICEKVSQYYTKGSPVHSVKPVEKLAKSYELLRKKFLAE